MILHAADCHFRVMGQALNGPVRPGLNGRPAAESRLRFYRIGGSTDIQTFLGDGDDRRYDSSIGIAVRYVNR